MIGYVLWGDSNAGKAIIWCEDQGDLAYYCKAHDSSRTSVCKGDWVQFDLEEDGNLRLAANTRILEGQTYPALSEMLLDCGSVQPTEARVSSIDSGLTAQAAGSSMTEVRRPANDSNVIPFPDRSSRGKPARYG